MDTFIIQVEYGGLGDHLFYSHLPRIAKEKGVKKVLISTKSANRNPEYMDLIWRKNPHVDGTTDDPGFTYRGNPSMDGGNVFDATMIGAGLDNGTRWNEPEIYYKPEPFPEISNLSIYDPNYVSFLGSITPEKIRSWMAEKNIKPDVELMVRGKNMSLGLTPYPTSDIWTFCRILASCREIYCTASGASVLSRALGRTATVFTGREVQPGFLFSKNHTYVVL